MNCLVYYCFYNMMALLEHAAIWSANPSVPFLKNCWQIIRLLCSFDFFFYLIKVLWNLITVNSHYLTRTPGCPDGFKFRFYFTVAADALNLIIICRFNKYSSTSLSTFLVKIHISVRLGHSHSCSQSLWACPGMRVPFLPCGQANPSATFYPFL